jgi:hypothetical protein
MPAIIKQQFRTENAANFVSSFATNPTYLMLGQARPWVATPEYPSASDTAPLPPEDTYSQLFRTYRNALGAKRIQSADVVQSAPRYTWTTATVYTQYDSEDQALFGKNFYVMNSAYQVYKCISNNFGVASTTEPTGTSTSVITTADGYKWKYMFTISTGSVLKFLNPSFIPVEPDAIVAAASIAGQIYTVGVVSGGTGYVNGTSVPVTITGDGTGATATATVVGGVVTKITITAVGSDYTTATISMATGTGLVAYANLAPIGGHGKNAIDELGAFYVTSAVSFEAGEAGDISTANDFRSISMVRNPLQSDNSTAFTASTAKMTTTINVSSSAGFLQDAQITAGSSTAYIVEVGSGYLLVNDVVGVLPSTGAITGAGGGSTTITSLVQPEIYKNSGKLLYIEQRTPVQRAPDQVEAIRVVFEF